MSENQHEEIDENQKSDEEWSNEEAPSKEMSENQHEEWRDEEAPRCRLSDPALPHKVSFVAGHETNLDCCSCGRRSTWWTEGGKYKNFHFYCPTCQVEFHRDCLVFPSKMIHPYHPQHPLTLTSLNKYSDTIVDANYGEIYLYHLSSGIAEFQKTFSPISGSKMIFDKCTWCGNNHRLWFYRCLICSFSLDFYCAKNLPPLTIQNPKSHHHSLSFIPRPLSFPCDACGLIKMYDPGYSCYQCNYFVHRSCIDLPRVIKLTRHPHRLSHTPNLPTKVTLCRVCYQNVDIKYGQYSCSHDGCSYVAHSKCATHEEVWDGEELEWVPEESKETKDIAPYKKVGHGLIEHCCHDHHYLKLEKYDGTRDSGKQCQGCMRSIIYHDFYNCIECDYFLHEVCANLPRKIDHTLHSHTLSLFKDPHDHSGDPFSLKCGFCYRGSSGWRYVCEKEICKASKRYRIEIDVNCILVPDYFTHQSHVEHPLFITGHYGSKGHTLCSACDRILAAYRLLCTICEFALCYECSTIPNEVYYKFDEHPLSLCYGESGMDDVYWCEVCEKRLDPTKWFYTNKEGCTTIHLECLFGDSTYMKPGHTFIFRSKKTEVISNNSSSRPICSRCDQRCPQSVYFKKDGTANAFCSLLCLTFY